MVPRKATCRVFGLAAHTLAALPATVIHNLEQTGRIRTPEKDNPSTPARADQATPDTTAASPTQRPGQSTPTRATALTRELNTPQHAKTPVWGLRDHSRPRVMVGVPGVCLLLSRTLSPLLSRQDSGQRARTPEPPDRLAC